MRTIKRIFIHCTATRAGATVADIEAAFKSRGWRRPGYHYLIDAEGRVTSLLDEALVSNGVKGYNQSSVNVAYIGGLDASGRAADTRTDKQRTALAAIVADLRQRYPAAVVMGHRDISPDTNRNGIVDPWERIKECPCFDAISEYGDFSTEEQK